MGYFPNGSSGEVLDEQCANCLLGSGWNDPAQQELFVTDRLLKPCPVAFVQLTYNYKQGDKGNKDLRDAMTLLIDDRGVCQVREQLLKCRKEISK